MISMETAQDNGRLGPIIPVSNMTPTATRSIPGYDVLNRPETVNKERADINW